ncbi:MAG: hypothetical protein WA261_08385 [Candidatus Sulfotelmatobacter sp.]
MNDETSKPVNPGEHETFEHQDLRAAGILYFLLSLTVVTILCMFGLKGLYAYLDHRERATQSAVNPLVKNVPEDTRHIPRGYPQTAFPSPRLEEDERGQLNGIRLQQDDELYSYGWVDEKAGVLHIPIERAMGLLAQRGLPVRSQGERHEGDGAQTETNVETNKTKAITKKGEKK